MTRSGPSSARPEGAAGPRACAVLLAGGRGARLLDLTEREAKPALFMGGRRRLVDYALQEVARAGLPRALVLAGWCPGTLERHLSDAWGAGPEAGAGAARPRIEVRDGGTEGTVQALRHARSAIDGPGAAPAEVAVLSAGRAGAFDLPALLAAHREGRAPVTLLALPAGAPLAGDGPRLDLAPDGRVLALGAPEGGWVAGGAAVLDWPWARDRLGRAAGPGRMDDRLDDLLGDLLPLALAEGALRAAPQPGAVWRDAATPDAFRRAFLELQAGVPIPLPPEHGPAEAPLGAPDLVVEVGGLTLTVPRFGARRGGRWTLLEDSAVMPGARVAPGARLIRALVGPGAIVPSGLAVGEDPAEDARWFRLCPGPGAGPEGEPPTVLVTAPMLARRAAERMRAHASAAIPTSASTSVPASVPASAPAATPGGPAGLTPLEST